MSSRRTLQEELVLSLRRLTRPMRNHLAYVTGPSKYVREKGVREDVGYKDPTTSKKLQLQDLTAA